MTESNTLAGTPATSGKYAHGAFVWHEYVTRDAEGAKAFYTALFGWTVKAMPMGDGPAYQEIFVGEKPIGGFYQMDELPAGAPPHWFGYVSVADVDQASAKAAAAGGQVMSPAKDIPHVGRFSVLADGQGAAFSVFHSVNGDPDQEMTPGLGEFCWDSLNTTDAASAKKFYAEVIGWVANEHGVFEMGDKMEASFDDAQPGMPSTWLAHAFVPNLAEMRTKAESLGAKILMAEVPAGPWGTFAVVQDPQGAAFSLFQANPQQ